MSLEGFKARFKFNPTLAGCIGVEQELFITDRARNIVPAAAHVLAHTDKSYDFGYELSACQLETRTGPACRHELRGALDQTRVQLYALLDSLGYRASHREVGPKDMPLDVFPDPSGRYQQITKNMPAEIFLAACRVIGTHVHIGMRDYEEALRVYTYVIQHLEKLRELGNGSFGECLAIYRQMAPDYKPEPYIDWNHYY
ncbi:MAG TPA: glutamate-cysteine ligase family protein [Candidatus Paceibacterota bacterium]